MKSLFVLLLAATTISAGPTMGPAAPFNVFVFDTFNVTGADTGGRIAVGGNATFNANYYAVSQFLNTTRDTYLSSYNLIVKGSVTLNPASNNKVNLITGNAWVNITGDCGKIQLAGGGTCSSVPPAPIDFTSTASYFNSLANYYPTLTGTTVTGSSLTFNITKRGLNVFNVAASTLQSANSIAFTNADATQDTIIVNVTGLATNFTLPNVGITFNGQATSGESSPTGYQRIIWNFPTTATITGGSWAGSIIAPNAAASLNNGQFIGQLVAKSFSGNVEFHDYVFTGDAGVPEPATWVLTASALLLLRKARRVLHF